MATTMNFLARTPACQHAPRFGRVFSWPIFLGVSLWLGLATPMAQAQNATPASVAAIQKQIHLGRYSQALKLAETQLVAHGQDVQLLFLRGVALSELGQTADAIHAFEKLIETAPEMPEPYNNLAVLHAQRGELELAKHALEMAIRTKPDYAMAYENLGDIYARLAARQYQRAQALEQDNPPLNKKLGTLNHVLGIAPQAYKPIILPAQKTSTLPF